MITLSKEELKSLKEAVEPAPIPEAIAFDINIKSRKKTDEERKEQNIEQAAMSIIAGVMNTSPNDVMLPKVTSMVYNKAGKSILVEMESHQFLRKTKKYRLNINVEEVL